jgi:hypothetical protein
MTHTLKFSSGKLPEVQIYRLNCTRQYRAKPTSGKLPEVKIPEVVQA